MTIRILKNELGELQENPTPYDRLARLLEGGRDSRLSGGSYVREYAIDNIPSEAIFDHIKGNNCRIAVVHGHGNTIEIHITGVPGGVHFALLISFKQDGSHTPAHYLIDNAPVRWDTPDNEKPNIDKLLDLVFRSQTITPHESSTTKQLGVGRFTAGYIQEHIFKRVDYTLMSDESKTQAT